MPEENRESRTKFALSETLKALMRKKPLNQIRIRELTELCGMRRQSFYYHFTDVYELFSWSVRQERQLLIRRQDHFLNWQQALRDLMNCISQDQAYYRALVDSRGSEGLRDVFGGAVESVLRKTLDYCRLRSGETATEAEMELRLQCGTTVLLALLEGWVRGDLRQSPEEIGGLLERTMRQALLGATWQNLHEWEYM